MGLWSAVSGCPSWSRGPLGADLALLGVRAELHTHTPCVCARCPGMHDRLPGAHCRHSHAEVPRQCEADMFGKTVSHQEETGELETQRPGSYKLYI